jgi:hypothetical protein
MNATYLNGNEPGVKRLAGISGYTGKRIAFSADTTVTLRDTFWSEGQRYTYTIVELATGQDEGVPHQAPAQFGGSNYPPFPMRAGFALVEHQDGYKPSVHIYVHPNDAPQLLPTDGAEVTDNQKIVLEFTSALKNTYGGETNIRFKEAHRKTGITAENWESAQRELIEAKLLRKNGSITPNGRNVDIPHNLSY